MNELLKYSGDACAFCFITVSPTSPLLKAVPLPALFEFPDKVTLHIVETAILNLISAILYCVSLKYIGITAVVAPENVPLSNLGNFTPLLAIVPLTSNV